MNTENLYTTFCWLLSANTQINKENFRAAGNLFVTKTYARVTSALQILHRKQPAGLLCVQAMLVNYPLALDL
jgi:hypothetical protein